MPQYTLALVCILTFSFSQAALTERGLSRFTQKIEKQIKKSRLPKGHLGLSVSVISEGQPHELYNLNSTKKFIPASLTKVPTALAAFHILGLEHKFLTTLEANSPVVKGRLTGSLYLVGHGDPAFTSESMWSLVNEFKRAKIHTIEGDIVVDDTFFDSERYDQNRDPHRKDRAYDAPVGAMSFNWNSVNIFVRPTQKGQPPSVYIDPIDSYFKVINKAKTIAGRRQRLKISRIKNKDQSQFPFETIVISGSIGRKAKEYVSYKSITRPEVWSGYNLKAFLLQRGVKVLGAVKIGKKPGSTKVLSKYESLSLSHAIQSMNKYSNNFVAEMLIKNIAAQSRRPGTMNYGLKKVNEYLQKIGLESEHYNYENASGLTKNNFFRPVDFTQMLVGAQQDSSIFPELLTSLPISALDGTLKKRMTQLYSAKKVRAKTGMLNEVSGLAGYIKKEAKTYVFTFLYNGPSQKNKEARDLFDYLTEAIVVFNDR